jgi:cyclopropane-fatty-acyl-phospholipid synthase
MIKQVIARNFIKTLSQCEYGSIALTTPDGNTFQHEGSSSGSRATLNLNDWQVPLHFLLRGDIGLAEDYRDGLWETNDIVALMEFGLQNDGALNHYLFGSMLHRLFARLAHFRRHNSVEGSRRNIPAHYDLGNDFYRLWLDPSMTYSSALFKTGEESLEDAQRNKYSRIIEQLDQSSGRLLEIGCGWGGFAETAVQKGDFAIKGITLSQQQHEYASKRLAEKAQIAIEDYREQQGKYDFIVSIEMFEAVGERYWKTFFETIKKTMAARGKAIIQTITIDDRYFESYRKSGDLIRSFIFPGGMLPSMGAFSRAAESVDLRVNDIFAFGKDYARTLRCWLEAFDHRRKDIMELGFDESFIRLWRLYLASCAAAFEVGRTQVVQVELQHAT